MPNEAGKQLKKPRPPGPVDPSSASIPSVELLKEYGVVSPDLPALVLKEWGYRHWRAFWYALVATIAGALLALRLVLGFIYLVMIGHSKAAGILLGGGALSMVAGFRASRL